MTSKETKAKILAKFSRRTRDKQMTLMSPFAACKARKVLFFHIAKTGGSAIHQILRKNGLDDGMLSQKRGHYEQKLAYFTDIVEHWDEYYKFTMIRNKYALLVSNWNYDKKHLKLEGVKHTHPIKHFRAFIKQVVKADDENYGYWIDQHYITTIDDEPIFDLVGNYEHFDRDLARAMTRIGISNYNSKRRVNFVPYQKKIPTRDYYDEESKAIVLAKFRTEIEHFGFTL